MAKALSPVRSPYFGKNACFARSTSCVSATGCALPAGLDTLLGPGGRGLSVGEAKLLGLARALLHDPGLVILDEPSSRVDPATEQLVSEAIARLLAGRTGLIVAHRLETLDRVDSVLVLEDGRIAKFGPRDQLPADGMARFFSTPAYIELRPCARRVSSAA
jgi:ABC-type multidrug transport system fused ATPase/permease subunit